MADVEAIVAKIVRLYSGMQKEIASEVKGFLADGFENAEAIKVRRKIGRMLDILNRAIMEIGRAHV